jgi:linoleoyl-CoA desaturase
MATLTPEQLISSVTAETSLRAAGHGVLNKPGRRAAALNDQWKRLAILATAFQLSYWLIVLGPSLGLGWVRGIVFAAASMMMGLCVAGALMQVLHPSLHMGLNGPILISQFLIPSCLGRSWWQQKHNVVHHRSTNRVGEDDDLNVPKIFRVAPGQAEHALQRIQPILLPATLPLLHLGMISNSFRFALTGLVGHEQRMTASFRTKAQLLLAQFGPTPLMIGLLAHTRGLPTAVLVSLLVTLTIGTVLALVFTVEHTVSEVSFNPDPTLGWYARQLSVSADTATGNRFVTWYVGGLNHHIEHHLYPKAAPHELPELRRLVRRVCAEHDLSVTEFPTWRSAWLAHVRHLRTMSVSTGSSVSTALPAASPARIAFAESL